VEGDAMGEEFESEDQKLEMGKGAIKEQSSKYPFCLTGCILSLGTEGQGRRLAGGRRGGAAGIKKKRDARVS